MSDHDLHHDWLALIEISGPFLAVPVLKEAFPQGLEELDGLKRKRLRQAYEEWREALETDDPQFAELHIAWIDEVLSRGLELDEDGKGDVLKRADWCAANLNVSLPEHGATLFPDLAVIDEQRANKPLLLIHTYGQDVDLDATLKLDGWAATPSDRMVQLCRATGCRLGLVTNGERWMLVDAPVGAVTTFASWYARIWSQESITLQAFVHLLGIRRFFVDESEQLPALFDRSLKYQDEVTDALGEQVRRAVEVLIQALDKADQDRDRELLRDVKESELYEAALTVMMRLVFLLSAEERGLLLLGDERYEANYALSTLRMQLRKESEEILERRWDAWSRLLAIFRAVFGGIEHENLRLPALGGSLFDPDRFPFLEGRAKGSDWRTDTAKPLPIDNRTVLLLLEAIQQFQGRTLSYRALDVEQIGYVYEGLLERTVKRTAVVTLELDGTKNAKVPWVELAELESARLYDVERLAELLQERSGSSASRVRNDLAKPVDDALSDRLLAACHGDTVLRDRIAPYAHLLRTDPWGYPLVYPAGAFIVTTGSDRRETGTHYTPKSLTEAIVTETLTPVVYVGPAEGEPRDEWELKSPAELLDLKICDPAMGSGAFLVQACRWLAERLVEAWSQAEATGKTVSVDGEVLDIADAREPLPRDAEARTVTARRLIAERCLYGVDMNPLAVELAKLSIWLVTLAKGRPFGFLDHNLRYGDSLLGIHRLDQLTELSMTPGGKGQQRLFGKSIEHVVNEAIKLRLRLRKMPIHDMHDVEAMARLDADARRRLEVPENIADAFIGHVFSAGAYGFALETELESLAIQAGQAVDGDRDSIRAIINRATIALSDEQPRGKAKRKPFHWPLEFPEVFFEAPRGFHAVIGNPPFVGGQLISGAFGERYAVFLASYLTIGKTASVDLVVYFFLRSFAFLRERGQFGLLGRRSLSEGKNRESGLAQLIKHGGQIYFANTDIPWPGKASVVVHEVHVRKGEWSGERYLNGKVVETISSYLTSTDIGSVVKLSENLGRAFQGTILLGEGFKVEEAIALEWINLDSKYSKIIFPFIGGSEVNRDPECKPMCWVINFWDWPETKCAEFKQAYRQVKEKVLPERLKQKNEGAKRKWWIHYRYGWDLYHRIGRGHNYIQHPENWDKSSRALERVICISTGVTKYPAFTFLSAENIFSNKLCVIADDHYSTFAILSSDIHSAWAWFQKTSMGGDLHSIVYAHGNIFETYPFPSGFWEDQDIANLSDLGEKLYEKRQGYMLAHNKGLTKFYNDFHNQDMNSADLTEVREIQNVLNMSVAKAYGWQDLDLGCDFREVGYLPEGRNWRFAISESARVEVLHRLCELNRQIYEEEVVQGLHAGTTTTTHLPLPRRPRTESTPQQGLDFGADFSTQQGAPMAPESGNQWGSTAVDQILAWLEAHDGWFQKQIILNGCGASPEDWNSALAELLADHFVEVQGDSSGARYRAKQ